VSQTQVLCAEHVVPVPLQSALTRHWTQLPAEHLPVVQVVPSALLTGAGQPVAGTQAPMVWHWLATVQVTALPPPQVPLDWQVSPVVQALLSLQAAPVATTQAPVVVEHGLHAPQAAPAFVQVPVASQVCG
jgi:hypothetical protein